MEKNLYFPVDALHFKDLFDWADPSNKGRTTSVTVNTSRAGSGGSRGPGSGSGGRRAPRQSSQTGTMVEVNEQKIALFRYNDRAYAVSEKCPHAGGPLHVGDIEVLPDKSICVRCPWHSWCFDLDTGEVKQPKGRDLKPVIYPTRITEDGEILIAFDSFSPQYFTDDCKF